MSTMSSSGGLLARGQRWLPVVYGLGVGLLVLALLQLLSATPQLYRYYSAVCETGCGLTPADVRLLSTWGLTPSTYAALTLSIVGLFALLWATISALIFWQTAQGSVTQPFAHFVAFTLALTSLSWPTQVLRDTLVARGDLWSMSAVGLMFCNRALLAYMLVLFPDGRLTPTWLVVPLLLLTSIGIGNTFIFPMFQEAPVVATQQNHLVVVVVAATTTFALGVQLLKYRQATNLQLRRQMRWFLGAVIIVALSIPLTQVVLVAFSTGPMFVLGITLVQSLLGLSLPLAIGAAVLRERLWGLPIFVNRALVYGLLSGCIIVLYVVLVGGMGTLLQTTGAPLLALLASGVVAILALPLRDRLQRGVNTLLYGQRDDPYAVVARLGAQLEQTAETERVQHTLVETVARALKLPYVAISLCEGPEQRITAAYGTARTPIITLPLMYHDEQLGELYVAPRGNDPDLTRRDRALLSELARQAGMAIQAARLSRDLQRSRERLVLAREEERRRLRRDLHDDVGPTLASIAQRIDTASYLVAENPQAAADVLHDVKAQVRATVADIRRAVYDLRPPILDECGLLVAIRDHAIAAHAHRDLAISLSAPDHLPPLPAAVEVAALRIVQEALTNVVRHAAATQANVQLSVEQPDRLVVEISDNGRGLPAVRRAGIGLQSMRERAEELGGTFSTQARPNGGTHIRATLPCAQL